MLVAKLCLTGLHPSCVLEEFVRQSRMDSFSPRAGPVSASCASHFFKDLFYLFLTNINWLFEWRQQDMKSEGVVLVDLQAHTNDPPIRFLHLPSYRLMRFWGEAQGLVPNQAACRVDGRHPAAYESGSKCRCCSCCCSCWCCCCCR